MDGRPCIQEVMPRFSPSMPEAAGRADESCQKLSGNLGDGYLSGPTLTSSPCSSRQPLPLFQGTKFQGTKEVSLPHSPRCTYKYTHYSKIGPFP